MSLQYTIDIKPKVEDSKTNAFSAPCPERRFPILAVAAEDTSGVTGYSTIQLVPSASLVSNPPTGTSSGQQQGLS